MTMTPYLDDPRLTAYALGELEGPAYAFDRFEMESLIALHAEARRFVEDLRHAVASLSHDFALEIAPGLDDARRAVILGNQAEQFEMIPAMRLAADDDVDDAEGRPDVYHVITHPVPEPRRYRHNLLAVAAAVAIVATTLTLLVSSLFRGYAPVIAHNPATSTAPPIPAVASRPADKTADLPELVDGFAAKSPRDIFSVIPADGALQPLGVATTISVAPVRVPATNPAAAPAGAYALSIENPFFDASHNPLSSFAFNVGSTSYSAIRQAIAQGRLPDQASVRIEELINNFPYNYNAPTGPDAFASYIEVAACPWETKHRLVRIGLKARDLDKPELVADDLQIAVEFNPVLVSAYRLIGYDRRYLSRDLPLDPNKPNQIRSGQSVTALYEVIPIGEKLAKADEPLKYQKPAEFTSAATKGKDLLTVKLRYTDLQNDPARFAGYKSQEVAVMDTGIGYRQASDDFKFAAAVAEFGLLLRESPHKGTANYDSLLALAQESLRADFMGERVHFVELVQHARRL